MRKRTAIGILLTGVLSTACAPAEQHPVQPSAAAQTPAAVAVETTTRPHRAFDRTAHSTVDPASIWVVVNKKHPISPDYRPEITLVRGYQVATPAAGPLARLLDDSDRHGLGFKIASAYRSYGYQAGVYGNVVAASGQAAADRVSARPGHSEHQTGLAVDLVTPAHPGCDFEQCFAHTVGGRWLARHAWSYGFVVRYQPGNERVTGYSPEPWHLRYVGHPLAAELRRTHTDSLEELFGITGGDYR